MAEETDPELVFDILERMGEGSYGSVWKAIHKRSKRVVAVKIIPVEQDLNDLMKEITILKECRNDYIIRYYGSYYKDGDLWIVMEFGDCGSIADSMNKEPNVFSEEEIQYLLASILLGIAYLHENKKLHRDIKAGNVLLTSDGKAKLADFGVSAKLDTTLSKRNTVIGTPFWMAPEIIQEISYDGKADIWSLGITAIELAEGQPPYSNIHPMRAIFMIPNRPSPRLRQQDWSHNYADFVSKCLNKDPESRPSARELLQHPFVCNAAKELVEHRGESIVLKKMVERLVLRREELAKMRKKAKAENGADFGNTILNTKNAGARDCDFSDSGTIVEKPSAQVSSQNGDDSTIRENHHIPQQPISVSLSSRTPVSVPIPRPPPAPSPIRSNMVKPALHPPPTPTPTPTQQQQQHAQHIQPPHAQIGGQYNAYRGVQPVPIRLPQSHGGVGEINHSPMMNGGRGFSPANMANREQFFAPNSLGGHGNSSNSSLPVAHLQMSLGLNNPKPQSEVQQMVMSYMPTLPVNQSVQLSGSSSADWRRLNRRGEELRQQFCDDFKLLFETYQTAIQQVITEMQALGNGGMK